MVDCYVSGVTKSTVTILTSCKLARAGTDHRLQAGDSECKLTRAETDHRLQAGDSEDSENALVVG